MEQDFAVRVATYRFARKTNRANECKGKVMTKKSLTVRIAAASALLVVAPMVAPVGATAQEGSSDLSFLTDIFGSSAPAAGATEGTATGAAPVSQASSYKGNKVEVEKAQKIFELTNKERTSRGLAPLEFKQDLADGAYEWAKKMDRTQDFTHSHGGYGENLFWFAKQGSPELVVEMWMKSEGHRNNILSPDYKTLGVGVSDSGNGTYAVQRFGV